MNSSLLNFAFAILICGLNAACSGGAKATLSFSNSTSGAASIDAFATATPTVFEMKLVAAYLSQDIDSSSGNNTGATTFIYLNPECNNNISACDIGAGSGITEIVSTFFNFGASSATVNAALNSQELDIDAGTYKYVRLEFCKFNSANDPNIKWNYTGGPTTDLTFTSNNCTVDSAEMDPPITIAEEDTVTINLEYDLSAAHDDAGSGGDNCDPSSTNNCLNLPTFVPTVTK